METRVGEGGGGENCQKKCEIIFEQPLNVKSMIVTLKSVFTGRKVIRHLNLNFQCSSKSEANDF